MIGLGDKVRDAVAAASWVPLGDRRQDTLGGWVELSNRAGGSRFFRGDSKARLLTKKLRKFKDRPSATRNRFQVRCDRYILSKSRGKFKSPRLKVPLPRYSRIFVHSWKESPRPAPPLVKSKVRVVYPSAIHPGQHDHGSTTDHIACEADCSVGCSGAYILGAV